MVDDLRYPVESLLFLFHSFFWSFIIGNNLPNSFLSRGITQISADRSSATFPLGGFMHPLRVKAGLVVRGEEGDCKGIVKA